MLQGINGRETARERGVSAVRRQGGQGGQVTGD